MAGDTPRTLRTPRTKSHKALNVVDEAMPKPCGDFFAENHVAEPFSTNTENVACSFMLSPSTRK